ncbi:hypothetical protein D0C36_18175 [Mucilaginibacter conchicola]|uniref:Uncharacterized protein n=1 Tax=Mucilaginibacter conchicola TaxID=2303333 RepID=A0A372NPT5_9SPHI|nr:hypothetical protein D0C36_18175 [Mucilaginibacter conchicola]
MIQKKQKIKSAKRLLFAQCLYPANRSEPRAGNLLPFCAQAPASIIDSAMPLQQPKATIVLPTFIRSFFADKGTKGKH